MKKPDVSIDVDKMQAMRRGWAAYKRTLDSGSYCENASPEYLFVAAVVEAITTALEHLEKYERQYT